MGYDLPRRRRYTLIVSALVFIAARPASSAEPEVLTNSLGMKLVLIPAGEFMMGAEEDRSETLKAFPYCDPEWLEGELPRHRVRITQPFYLGRYEVTLGQFLTFYHAAKYTTEAHRTGKASWGNDDGRLIESTSFRPWAPGWEIQQNEPAVYVTWNDAVAFCEWLSKQEGKSYRLPTEAEWEYACRAGSTTRYSFGNDPEDLVRYANAADQDRRTESEKGGGTVTIADFDENGERKAVNTPFPFLAKSDGYAWPSPGGKFLPNALGLYDMHGNVWEWCSDWYDEDYYAESPTDDPPGPADGSLRVLRGGGFGDVPVNLRSAVRLNAHPSGHYYFIGFRVVLSE